MGSSSISSTAVQNVATVATRRSLKMLRPSWAIDGCGHQLSTARFSVEAAVATAPANGVLSTPVSFWCGYFFGNICSFYLSYCRVPSQIPSFLSELLAWFIKSISCMIFPTSVMKGKLLESESSLTASMRLEMHRHQTLWTLVLKRLYCKWIMIGFHPPRWLQIFSAGCECDLLTVA